MRKVGYVHKRETDAIRYELILDGVCFYWIDNEKNRQDLTLPLECIEYARNKKMRLDVVLYPFQISVYYNTYLFVYFSQDNSCPFFGSR